MNPTILIINHSVTNCGVYQYGKRFSKNLEDSTKYRFLYKEIDSFEALEGAIHDHGPVAVIYNYLNGTMPWFSMEKLQSIRHLPIRHGIIVHHPNYPGFDFYLHQNPNHIGDEKNFALPRPLFKFSPQPVADDGILRIGSFGFGFHTKYYDNICGLVQSQFHDRNVHLRLHLTESHFCENKTILREIEDRCRRAITSPSIQLEITREFLPDEDILQFLGRNNLNIFLYHAYPTYQGISSTMDYAISAQRPIAVNNSNLFSHIYDPAIDVANQPLSKIISNGFTLRSQYDKWIKFSDAVDTIMDQIL